MKIEIKDIRAGKGERSHIVYAHVFVDDVLSISATLDYCAKRARELATKEENKSK